MLLVVSPLTALISDLMCEARGYSIDLLFSSPETLENPVEKHYECLSNLSEKYFLGSLLMKRIAWFLGELFFFFQLLANHE